MIKGMSRRMHKRIGPATSNKVIKPLYEVDISFNTAAMGFVTKQDQRYIMRRILDRMCDEIRYGNVILWPNDFK